MLGDQKECNLPNVENFSNKTKNKKPTVTFYNSIFGTLGLPLLCLVLFEIAVTPHPNSASTQLDQQTSSVERSTLPSTPVDNLYVSRLRCEVPVRFSLTREEYRECGGVACDRLRRPFSGISLGRQRNVSGRCGMLPSPRHGASKVSKEHALGGTLYIWSTLRLPRLLVAALHPRASVVFVS